MENTAETNYTSNYDKKSILIIGAGPCGILSVRYLKDNHNILCVDNREDIGGQWHLDKYTESDHPNLGENSFYKQYGVLPSSLYENLQANLPKILMTFKGVPVKEEYDEFMKSEQFLEYMQNYCASFDLKKYMSLNNYVSQVRLSKNLTQEKKQQVGFDISKKFVVQVTSAESFSKNIRYLQADSVIVSTGHNSVPNYPQIKNSELFKGQTLHMHYFRESSLATFKDKHLIIYGCGLSAQDIVFITMRKRAKEMQPKKITVIGNEKMINMMKNSTDYAQELSSTKLVFLPTYIREFDSANSLILESGERVEDIDVFLYATGYVYSYPFLSDKDNLIDFYNKKGRSNSFGPLYKKIFSVREPNLIFLGAIQNTLSIQQCYERQVLCVSRYLNNDITLPSYEQMLEEFKKEYDQSLITQPDGRDYLKVSFFIGLNELVYVQQLSELSKIPVDEEFNKYLKEIVLPVYIQIMMSGNYSLLKNQKISHKFPENYSPKLGFM